MTPGRYATKGAAVAIALTALLSAAAPHADAAVCTNGTVPIVPAPLPTSAYHTFESAQPGTKIYSYDIITVHNGKTSQDYLPTAKIACDATGVYITSNRVRTQYPPSVTITSRSLRTFAIFPGLAPTGDQAAQIRLGRTRLVRTVTRASSDAAAAASPTPSPTPTASPKPKKHFL